MNEAYSEEGPAEQAEPEGGEGQAGSTVCVNCYDNGTYDVYSGPLKPASEQEYPDGMFGLSSLEEALKAVIALKQSSKDFKEQEHSDMMAEFEGQSKKGY